MANEPIDLAAIERDHPGALLGCVLCRDASDAQMLAGFDAGLLTPHGRTPKGERVLAALRALFADKFGAFEGWHMMAMDKSAADLAAISLHDRERQP